MTNTISFESDDVQQWVPAPGPTFEQFIEHSVFPVEARDDLRFNCLRILGKGQPPDQRGQRTGLVLGRVQSGKTMSFTGVTALAHDNGFPLVIILAGTKNNLVGQTTSRLSRDLELGQSHPLHPTWKGLWVRTATPPDQVSDVLRHALSTRTSIAPPTALITLLKQGGQRRAIDHLAELLENLDLGLRRELEDRPVLIIDDEADEASLDASRQGNPPTSTYNAIARLRAAVPRNTYLQYTATPQAVLLLGLGDSLSPDFLHMLEPGIGYCGTLDFFGAATRSRVVRPIPQREADQIRNGLFGTEPPTSLRTAFLTFVAGAAFELATTAEQDWPKNRSMLVHPEVSRFSHQRLEDWVRAIFDSVHDILGLDDNDLSIRDLQQELAPVLADLATTTGRVQPSWADLKARLLDVMTSLTVLRMNADALEEPDWGHHFAVVAVGGNKLQRGYTLDGLTVTWMPRSPGLSQVDTILQRGRFFGYRADYLDYCRVFLPPDLETGFRRIVPHEEKLWETLRAHESEMQSLSDWRRLMLLDHRMRPCRKAVIRLPNMHVKYGDAPRKWFSQTYPTEGGVTEDNRAALEEIIASTEDWTEWPGADTWTEPQRARFAIKPVADILEQLLQSWRVADEDAARWAALLFQLSAGLDEHPDEQMLIVEMNYLMVGSRPFRSLGDNRQIRQLAQGVQRQGYPGDRKLLCPSGQTAFADDEAATVLDVYRLRLGPADSSIVHHDMPIVALRPGTNLRLGVLAQD